MKPVIDSVAEGSAPRQATHAPAVLFHVVNRVAIISLNRPQALNALSHEMVVELTRCFDHCREDRGIVAVVLRGIGDKAFCAGGDVRALYGMVGQDESGWLQFFIDEYRLDYVIHTFPKPVVALLDGITMGGGMGLGQGAALRVVTERTKMAMPETRIGLSPDVGATRFLTTMPVGMELYVGLTGVMLTGSDALYCNLADICVPSLSLASFEERLMQVAVPDAAGRVLGVIREVLELPGSHMALHSPLSGLAATVARHFTERASVEEIASSLQGDLAGEMSDEVRQWSVATLGALKEHSPTMLKVTREALVRGRKLSLGDCFRQELNIVTHALRDGDFREGVRAHLIDKDHQPNWMPATLAEVDIGRVQQFCSAPWGQFDHPLADLDYDRME